MGNVDLAVTVTNRPSNLLLYPLSGLNYADHAEVSLVFYTTHSAYSPYFNRKQIKYCPKLPLCSTSREPP